jgi:hypothetical protein
MRKTLGVVSGALLVLAACSGGGGGGSEKAERKASPTATAAANPTAPGQLEVTFGDVVPYALPPGELGGVFNVNHNPVTVSVTVTNHCEQEHTRLHFDLITSDRREWYALPLDPAILADIPPGATVQGQVIFGPLKTSGSPTRVEARDLDGPVVAGRDL